MCPFPTRARVCARGRRFTWSSQLTPGYLPDWICSSSHGRSLSRPHCCMLLQYLPTEDGEPPDNVAFSQEPMLNPTLPQETLPLLKKKKLPPTKDPTHSHLQLQEEELFQSFYTLIQDRTLIGLFKCGGVFFPSCRSTIRTRELCPSHLCFIHL